MSNRRNKHIYVIRNKENRTIYEVFYRNGIWNIEEVTNVGEK